MKLKPPNEVPPPAAGQGSPSQKARQTAPAADRVSVRNAAVSAAVQASRSTRVSRTRDIEAAVRQGTYKPDPSQIADQILDDAEVTAKLRALLNKTE